MPVYPGVLRVRRTPSFRGLQDGDNVAMRLHGVNRWQEINSTALWRSGASSARVGELWKRIYGSTRCLRDPVVTVWLPARGLLTTE